MNQGEGNYTDGEAFYRLGILIGYWRHTFFFTAVHEHLVIWFRLHRSDSRTLDRRTVPVCEQWFHEFIYLSVLFS